MRVVIAIPLVAAIALAVPAFAQDKMTDADAMAKVEKVVAQFDQGFRSQDAAALSKLYTPDGVYVAATGKVFTGQQQIADAYATIFKAMGGIKSFEGKVDQAHALSDGGAWAIVHATVEGGAATTRNHVAAIYAPEGDGLKVRMLSVGANVPPSPETAQTPAAPMSGSSTK
ncbi:MAG TPA: SgcJ/EcaC family oxidoreductase [Stellaceae bacterium]|nr:SgcJ/EcaC family oxidoreductase [Stellaceae bacterium]